jgi:phospholipase C
MTSPCANAATVRNARRGALLAALLTAGCNQGGFVGPIASQNSASQNEQAASKIKHVVIIFQENRTVDNLFNGLPGADTVRTGKNSHGQSVALRPVDMTAPYDLGHEHRAFETERAKGKWNGFDKVGSHCYAVTTCTPQGVRAYGYVPRDQVKPYFDMATQYAFADRMFQTNQGPSFPAHQYILSGTSTVVNGSALRAAENPSSPLGPPAGGCDSAPQSLVALIDLQGNETQRAYPCFNRTSLIDLLAAKSLSWRYYQGYIGPGLWNGPDAILRIRENRRAFANVIAPPATILTDVANGTLANVVWVTPSGLASDHPGSTDGSEPSWVASVVNAIGQSKFWNTTAIFVTWDDWGGWFDHVVPPQYNSYELSFRVPLVVVSPYAKNHYVSHRQHEFASMLKFAERVFGLGSLHTTDVRSDDLFDCFDFSKPPTKFKRIPAKFPPSYFLKQPANVVPVDDDF